MVNTRETGKTNLPGFMRAVCELLIAEYRPGKQRRVYDMQLWAYRYSVAYCKNHDIQPSNYEKETGWFHLVSYQHLTILLDFLRFYSTKMNTRLAVLFGGFFFESVALKVNVAEIMIGCTGSQADMSPLSTIAAITLPWSIVLHDILHPLPIHLFLLHFQSSLPPCLIYST